MMRITLHTIALYDAIRTTDCSGNMHLCVFTWEMQKPVQTVSINPVVAVQKMRKLAASSVITAEVLHRWSWLLKNVKLLSLF